jgi:hypothetical protein
MTTPRAAAPADHQLAAIVTGWIKVQRVSHTGPIGGITLREQRNLPALDLIWHPLHRSGDILEQAPPLAASNNRSKLPACV